MSNTRKDMTLEESLERFSKSALMRYCQTTFNWCDIQALRLIELEAEIMTLTQELSLIGERMQSASGDEEFRDFTEEYSSCTQQIEKTENRLCTERKRLQAMAQESDEVTREMYFAEARKFK